VHFILNKPIFSDYLSDVGLFQSIFGRSHRTGLSEPIFIQ
jgi:hypothetical protein